MYIMSNTTTSNPYEQTGGTPPVPDVSPVGPVKSYSFVLDQFTSSTTMLKGLMQTGEQPTSLTDVSAVAVFNIDISAAKQIFRFSSNAWDISNNIPIGSLHYFLNADAWPKDLTLNPANAMLDQPTSKDAVHLYGKPAESLVKHDFIRYLALRLFNTPLGADLFSNQSEMINYLTTEGNHHWQNDISANLWNFDIHRTTNIDDVRFLIDGSSNQFCTTDNYTANDNITRELFQQIVYAQDARFQNVVLDQYNQAPIPFIHGDSISYKFTINPAAGQETVTGVPPFAGRTYRIQLNIFDSSIIPIHNTVPLY